MNPFQLEFDEIRGSLSELRLGRSLHHLTFDQDKRRWVLRFTVDLGPRRVGKRIKVRLKAQGPAQAAQIRDNVLAAYKAGGLKIRQVIRKERGTA